MKQNQNSKQIPQITNQPSPINQQTPTFQNINNYPIQNQQHVLDQDLKSGQMQNHPPQTIQQQQNQMNQVPMNQAPMNQMPMNQIPMGQMPMNQMPMGQMPMNQMPMGQMPMGQMPMGQMPMGQISYPNGMVQQPIMVMPVMMPGYGMMGIPNCVKCHGLGVKPNGRRCPCIGGKTDSEELEDGIAMGIAFSRMGFGYRYPYYGYRGYW